MPPISAHLPERGGPGDDDPVTDLAAAHVLVLGATGGLGGAIARRLVASGARVSLSGRDETRLQALADELGAAVVARPVSVCGGRTSRTRMRRRRSSVASAASNAVRPAFAAL